MRALVRLLHAGWRLVRNDALLPREIDEVLPGELKLLARSLRLFSGSQARRGRPGERLARSLETLGPAAIKLGQVLSTRADIFGDQFAADLSHLKDRLAPFSQDIARASAETALGRPLETLFAEFGPVVAAASLAQAHEAKLLDGRRVAVKLLRPGIERRVDEESDSLRLAARLAEKFVPASRRLEPVLFTAEIVRALELELDLRFEAAGAAMLGEIMAGDGYMTAPTVVWPGVARRMLTLEWAQGVALSDPAALVQPGLDRKSLAANLTRAFLSQALDHGVFHADLHEGNLFVVEPDRLVAVDFGIVGRLGPVERRYLAEILWGFLNRDYQRVAQVHFDAHYVPAHHDVGAFSQALRAVGEPLFGKAADGISMGRVLGQLFDITALFDMRLRPELVLLQKTMVTVEGVARGIDPEHDIWGAAEPVVRRWITRELGPAAKARDLLKDAADAMKAMGRLARGETLTAPASPAPVIVERSLPKWVGWWAAAMLAAAAAIATAMLV